MHLAHASTARALSYNKQACDGSADPRIITLTRTSGQNEPSPDGSGPIDAHRSDDAAPPCESDGTIRQSSLVQPKLLKLELKLIVTPPTSTGNGGFGTNDTRLPNAKKNAKMLNGLRSPKLLEALLSHKQLPEVTYKIREWQRRQRQVNTCQNCHTRVAESQQRIT